MSEVMAEKVVDSTPKTVLVLGGSFAGMYTLHLFEYLVLITVRYLCCSQLPPQRPPYPSR